MLLFVKGDAFLKESVNSWCLYDSYLYLLLYAIWAVYNKEKIIITITLISSAIRLKERTI